MTLLRAGILVVAIVLLTLAPLASAQAVPGFAAFVQPAVPSPVPNPVAPASSFLTTFEIRVWCQLSIVGPNEAFSTVNPTFRVYSAPSESGPYLSTFPYVTETTVTFRHDDCVYGNHYTVVHSYMTTLSPEAPAFHGTELGLLAWVENSGHPAGILSVVKADFQGGFEVEAPHILLNIPQGAQMSVPVFVRNDANGAIQLAYDVLTTDLPDTDLVVPPPKLVGSTIAGADTDVAAMAPIVETYAPVGSIGVLTGTIKGHSADDGSRTLEPQTVRVVLRVVEPEALPPQESPAPNMVLPGLVVFALAVLMRRRLPIT